MKLFNDPVSAKPQWTIESLGYALSVGVAAVLRILALGRWPLSYDEASVALAAWRFARGTPMVLRGHSPLLLHANAALLFFANGSDAAVRWLPVVAGVVLVVLPWGLRRQLGRVGALAASFLFALSSTLTYFSRELNGSVIVTACALALYVLLARYLEERRWAYLVAAAPVLMIALLAGPGAYSLLAAFLWFPLFLRLVTRLSHDGAAQEEWQAAVGAALAERQAWRQALVLGGCVFLAGGVAFVANPAGLQLTLDQFRTWILSFELGSTPWYRSFALLTFYEALPLVGGLLGAVVERSRRDVFSWWLRWTLVFGVIVAIFPGLRSPDNLWLLLLPLILMCGQWVDRAWSEGRQWAWHPLFWVPLAVTLAIAAAAHVQLASYMNFPSTNHVFRLAALVVFLLSSLALVGSLTRTRLVMSSAAACLMVIGLLLMVRTNVRLNQLHGRDAVEPLLGLATSPDVLALANSAQDWSHRLTGDPRAMTWQVDQAFEVPLGWYLRAWPDVSFVDRVSAAPVSQAAITAVDVAPLPNFVSMRFDLRATWDHESVPVQEWLRWWIGYRSSLRAQPSQQVLVWVRPLSQ
jgi:uncharacterized protein (TIGR03663 family)